MTTVTRGIQTSDPWRHRVDSGDWEAITAEVNSLGGALLPELLTPDEAEQIRGLYEHAEYFRSTINMGRHRFGEGEYRYFKTPYPEPIERLKQALYPRLLPIARDWWAKLRRPAPWPDTLDEWLRMCHDAGQDRPTAILLRYRAGDWNALHRDLYGDLVFPAPGRHQPERTRYRPQWRGVPAGGAAAARPVPRHSHPAPAPSRLRIHHP